MTVQKPILQFNEVTVRAEQRYDTDMEQVSFSLSPGALLLILTEKTHRKLPLSDAAQGLIDAASGSILFKQQSWGDMSNDQAAACRGNTGRVFETWGWVSNLDLDENITLKERYWQDRTKKDIEEEAVALARQFGLDDLPRKRPAWVNRSILQRSQWVRALLGKPSLLLLAYPEQYVSHEHVEMLMQSVGERMQQGVAVVWFTGDKRVWDESVFKSQQHGCMKGTRMVRESEA